MKKYFLVSMLLLCSAALVQAVPGWGMGWISFSGAVASFIAGSGTNTQIEVVCNNEIPFRLSEVTSSASGTTTVYRVWQYVRDSELLAIETNMFGQVATNAYPQSSEVVVVTNTVYTSGVDTLPTSEYFVAGDLIRFDFNTQTGVVLRVMGTAQ